MRLMETAPTGPARKFGDAHIYYVLHILNNSGVMSRGVLADILGIGEGSVRKILTLLKEWDLVTVRQTGITLSDHGREFLKNIPMRLVKVPRSDYVIGTYQQGILVEGIADRITNGMYQRDSAIIAGATGASVLVMRDGALLLPKSWNMDIRDGQFAAEVRRSSGISEGDALIITGASDPDIAALSAVATGLDML